MEVLSGTLTLKVSSLLKSKQYCDSWCVLYGARGELPPRIELYDNSALVGKVCLKTIYIKNAKWNRTESVDSSFSFGVKHKKQYIFVPASLSELNVWVLTLCCVSKDLFNTRHILGIEDLNKMDSYVNADDDVIVEENNILYSSSNDLSTFIVTADPSDGCLKFNLKGVYKLRIEQETVKLLQHDTGNELISWPMELLKKFGHTSNTFFLETGSRSETGAAKFIFHTAEGDVIKHRLSIQVQYIFSQSQKSKINYPPSFSTMKPELPAPDVKNKPRAPEPPKKPVRTFSDSDNNLHHVDNKKSKYVNCQQSLQKNVLPIGVQVLPAVTNHSSNIRASDSVTQPTEHEGKGITNIDNLKDQIVDHHFKKGLVTRSISSYSSESENKKNMKKTEKDFKKEQKKREEDEKKKREEEKKEKKKEEKEKKEKKKKEDENERKMKKEAKKSKQKVDKRPSVSSQSSSPGTVAKNSYEYSEVELEQAYSRISVMNDSSTHQPIIAARNYNSERIYSEPWKDLLSGLPISNSNEVEYSQPEKKRPKDKIHVDKYSDCQVEDSQYPPAIVPPNWQDDSSTDLYSHLNDNKQAFTPHEAVYGMASASESVTTFEDENPYEDTGIPS